MSELPAGVRGRMLLRSLAVQGGWNYQTLIGSGFAYALLPALRLAYRGDDAGLAAAVRRHAELFNSHPYLATVAIGAVAKLEAERADPVLVDRFKGALRGSLGSLGDQLVWSVWRPASALLGLVLLLAGTAWWVGVAAFLLVYNVLHLALRAWGLRIGLASGLEVGKVLREAPLQTLAGRAANAGALLCGVAVVLAGSPALVDAAGTGTVLAAAAAGLWLGLRVRLVAVVAVVVMWVLATLLGLIA